MLQGAIKTAPSILAADFARVGMAAAAPFHRLRELSAFRFKAAGFTRTEAQSHIKECLGKANGDPNNVLPLYQSASWSEATQKAEQYMNILYPSCC